MGAGDAAKAQKTNDAEEDLDAPARKPKNVAPTVKCKGADLTRESLCVALSDLGGKQCPAKLPNRPENAEAGVFEKPPKGAKREPSLEESGSQCCYAWCGRIPSASPPVPCQNPEPLFCFDAPISTAHAAPPPYGECPMGLKAYKGKGRRKSSPKGAFSSARTKSRRKSAPNACCYQTCT